MCSLVPLDSVTVPLPDHEPSKPAKGPLAWVVPPDTDSNSAAPTPAAVKARPNRLEANKFMVSFPFNRRLATDASRHIEHLVAVAAGEVQIMVSRRFRRFPPSSSSGCGGCPAT